MGNAESRIHRHWQHRTNKKKTVKKAKNKTIDKKQTKHNATQHNIENKMVSTTDTIKKPGGESRCARMISGLGFL